MKISMLLQYGMSSGNVSKSMTEPRRVAELLKDKLDDEEVDLGWIYPGSIFAEGHRVGWGVGGDLSVVCFSFPVFALTKRRDRDL